MYTSSAKIYDSDVAHTLALLVNMGHLLAKTTVKNIQCIS